MTLDSRSFGEAIRKRRKALGYTQTYISQFSGLSVSFISDLENGKSTVELGKAIRYANLLGLDVVVTPRG
ncbi:MAG: helix-turn-helix transcriptional regulator [Lachnospiraceae bacterium]|nr:helix-turn-helix transcriptional regulator [Lachnospiraceae bacterium]